MSLSARSNRSSGRHWSTGLGLTDAPSAHDPAQWTACAELLTATFKTRTRDEWAEQFADTDACVAPVLTLDEAPNHPHNLARRSYTQVGPATMVDAAPKFSATPGAAGELTTIGGDTEALLAELGYDDLSELRSAGTIA